MIRTDTMRGRTALAVAQCAGMVDLVALPVWVGTLVQHYKFDPQQAGLLVTLFLAGAVLSSIIIAPLFHRLRSGRVIAVVAFAVASLIFVMLSQTSDFAVMAALHGVGGMAIGAALSVKDGTIARSSNPHRLFALCGAALGAFALVFLGAVPPLLAQFGGPLLFQIFGGIMLVGAVTSLLAFPALDAVETAQPSNPHAVGSSRRMLWAGIIGLCCMSIVQAMAFSFLERAGIDNGFGIEKVTAILVAVGVVNLFPTALAALLQKRVTAKSAMMAGAILQAILVFTVFNAPTFWPYAVTGTTFRRGNALYACVRLRTSRAHGDDRPGAGGYACYHDVGRRNRTATGRDTRQVCQLPGPGGRGDTDWSSRADLLRATPTHSREESSSH